MLSHPNSIGILDNRYILLKELGSGLTCITYKIIDYNSNKECVAKIFFEKYKYLFESEVEFNKDINKNENPSFTKYITSSVGEVTINNTTENKPYIIFELCSKGQLLKYINCTEEILNEKYIKIIFIKILKSIHSLHKMGIYHRDIKLENILLDEEYNIKISDFGLSSFILKDKNGINKKIKGCVGTTHYMAPEVIMNKPYDGIKADIFSLGVILFTLRTLKFGFIIAKVITSYSRPEELLYKYIKNKNTKAYWKYIENSFRIKLSDDFKKLYMKMVAFHPEERPKYEEILKDKYFEDIRYLKEDEIKVYEQSIIAEFKDREKKYFN